MSEVRGPRRVVVEEEFERFVRASAGRLFRAAVLLTGDRQEAEDLLQSALVRTARRWTAARAAPEAYARRVLVNLSHDRHRRLRRRAHETPLDRVGEAVLTVDPSGSVADREALFAALRQLPTRQREVIVLRFYLDLSVQDTAHALRCSEGTVKSYTARAIAKLRELLAELPAVVSGAEGGLR